MNVNHKGYTINVMTHSQLKLFVKIVDTGSFTRAGQELNMTQPAVSRAISTLESELGVTLLIRDRRKGIVLTEVGKRILVLFRDILKGFDKVDQEVAAEKGFEVGLIRIGSFPAASAHFLPKIFRAISEKYPRIRFELHEGSIDEIKEWLAARTIDVGWIIPPNEEFEAVTLLKEQMFLFMREDHPLHQHDRIHVKHLDQEPMIICKGGYEAPLYELFGQGGSRLQAQFIVHNANTALNMIEEGLGMAIMSNVSLSLSALPPHVVIRPLEPQPYREILLAVPSLEESSLAVKLFIQTARELFSI